MIGQSKRSSECLRSSLMFVLAGLLTAGLTGCGGPSVKDAPDVASAGGTVTFKGEPLANAQVLFIPDAPGKPSASGVTDASGYYTLTTQEPGDGALVGAHRVSITARGPDKALPENQLTSGLPGSNVAPGDPLIPEKYFSIGTSALQAEVPAGGATSLDFKLE